jgi:hypothetical protein
MGSLGRPRVVAWGRWDGGPVAREAKQLVLPATAERHKSAKTKQRYADIVRRAVRAPDPFLDITGNVVVRRLAPQSGKVSRRSIAGIEDERRWLHLMGRETANIHLGSPQAVADVRRDLKRRERIWLEQTVERLADRTLEDWRIWRRAWRDAPPKKAKSD